MQLCEGIDIDLERLEDGIEDQEMRFGGEENPERDNTQYDTQSEFSEIPQFQVMGEHSFKPRYTAPAPTNERFPTYYGAGEQSAGSNYIPSEDQESFVMPPPTLSAGHLIDAMRQTSPLVNRPLPASLPARYIPPPMPTKSDAEHEVQKLSLKLAELQDELEMRSSVDQKNAQVLQRREKELEALRKVLKEEVQSHDSEIEKLKSITQVCKLRVWFSAEDLLNLPRNHKMIWKQFLFRKK